MKRVMLAGTYNAHPVPTAAAIATLERLMMNNGEVYQNVETFGTLMEQRLETAAAELGLTLTVARQGSALCVYYMDHAPMDWHDLGENHAFEFDEQVRRDLVEAGICVFPLATKQWSISAAHTATDTEVTVSSSKLSKPGSGWPSRPDKRTECAPGCC